MVQTFVRFCRQSNTIMFFTSMKSGIGGYYISSGCASVMNRQAAAVADAVLFCNRKNKRLAKNKDAAQNALDRWRRKATSEGCVEEVQYDL